MKMRPDEDLRICQNAHDPWTLALSLCLCIGLIISYLPQHARIIRKGTSEGFSPWYLLLGATSSASGMLNLLIVQWPLFKCCKIISRGNCFESLLGFYQVTLQWLLFSIILVLYLVYFPTHLKYHQTLPLDPPTTYGAVEAEEAAAAFRGEDRQAVIKVDQMRVSTTPEWRLAITLGSVVALHLVFFLLLSLALLLLLPQTSPPHPLLSYLATFLGISATILAIMQYAPQIYRTYRSGLVGALSLGTMVIQVPGSVLFVISLVVRPGTNWTSWLAYAITGVMQGALLVLCLLWKQRQKRLGIDDFGNPLSPADEHDERQRLIEHDADEG